MRIGQIAPLFESVPPKLYGGTERVVGWLTEELVRRGHEVTLFASGDSRTSARLIPAVTHSLRLDPDSPDAFAAHVVELGQVLRHARELDVVHAHVDFLAFPSSRLGGPPIVHTLHGRLDTPAMVHALSEFSDVPLVSISDAQRAPVAHLGLRWMATVPHGLPLDTIPFSPAAGSYLAFLGRISPDKGAHVAIEVAKRVGIPLRIAAKVDAPDRAYFGRIRPLLDHPLVEFVGEVGDADKYRFLGDARALLFPIDWPEPFGLAMLEALACGTPVVARPRGSVPEIIRDGETGWIADTIDELVTAVKRLDLIDRVRCREDVAARFSVGAMADRYEAVYRRLAS